jgi:hypothetical protein
MTDTSIMICVACHNRRAIAELCLPTVRGAMRPGDYFFAYNDGSKEYDYEMLTPWADEVKETEAPVGIEAQRRQHLRDFWESGMDLLYFTDHDAIHDPQAFSNAIRLQQEHGGPLVCLYNTAAHSAIAGNTLEDKPESEVIWRHYAPGVSYLLTRQHVEKIMPRLQNLVAFDWQIPDILGARCAISRVSYVDHIGYGGQRHPAGAGYDGGDRHESPAV